MRRKRIYDEVIAQHFEEDRQMLFLMGPRQVGKTTASRGAGRDGEQVYYLNWDDPKGRAILASGPSAVADFADLKNPKIPRPVLAFDEIHKAPDWKNFLKGFFDLYGEAAHILVTGSARLDVYQKGGDSLVGRYFRLRVHPFTVAELIDPTIPPSEIRPPSPIDDSEWEHLLRHGGFPEPFLKSSERFSERWTQHRYNQVFREDLRDLHPVIELAKLELLAELLRQQAGGQANYTALAKHVRVASDTIRRWVELLKSVYYCFSIQPWSRNVSRSLLKEPKVYLHDWSQVDDEGRRFENFVAVHLLKAVQFWNDYGFGDFGLHYLRTKEQREVDFVITKKNKPWILIEAKVSANGGLAQNLVYFQERLGASHAFQLVQNLPFQNLNYFELKRPVIAPARAVLSQLI